MSVAFYWNLANIPKCVENLGRVTNALALIIQGQLPEAQRSEPIWIARVSALREVARQFWDLFDDNVRKVLTDSGFQPTE